MLDIKNKRRIRWGILGTSFISHVMAEAIKKSETAELIAVASRSKQRAYEIPLSNIRSPITMITRSFYRAAHRSSLYCPSQSSA